VKVFFHKQQSNVTLTKRNSIKSSQVKQSWYYTGVLMMTKWFNRFFRWWGAHSKPIVLCSHRWFRLPNWGLQHMARSIISFHCRSRSASIWHPLKGDWGQKLGPNFELFHPVKLMERLSKYLSQFFLCLTWNTTSDDEGASARSGRLGVR